MANGKGNHGAGAKRSKDQEILPDMAKLADAPDLGSGGAIHVGSTPIIRTFFS